MYRAERLTWIRNNPIKQGRKKIGMSQHNLALNVDSSLTTIKMIETGERGVTVERLLKIAKALNVDPLQLRLELDIWAALPPQMKLRR